jgi:hypothetical protein
MLGRVFCGVWARDLVLLLAQPDSEKTPIDSAQFFKKHLRFITISLKLME